MAGTLKSSQKFDFCNEVIAETVKAANAFDEGCKELKKDVEKIKMASIDKAFNKTVAFLIAVDGVFTDLGVTIGKISSRWEENSVNGDAFVRSAMDLSDTAKKMVFEPTVTMVEVSGGIDEDYDATSGKAIYNNVLKVLDAKYRYIEKYADAATVNATPDLAPVAQALGSGCEQITNSWVDVYDDWKAALKSVDILLDDEQEYVKKQASSFEDQASQAASKRVSVNPVKA